MKRIKKDAKLINALGGPTRVAYDLGFKKGGTQRVYNWTIRGIPPKVLLENIDYFNQRSLRR